MTRKEITVLMVEPGKHPKVTTLKDDLESLQKAVSIGADYQGLIEFVSLGSVETIHRIAKVLGCTIEDLMENKRGERGVFFHMREMVGMPMLLVVRRGMQIANIVTGMRRLEVGKMGGSTGLG